MIERRHGHWRITAGTSLTGLARRLGALDDAAEQISTHRKQRGSLGTHGWTGTSRPNLRNTKWTNPTPTSTGFPPRKPNWN